MTEHDHCSLSEQLATILVLREHNLLTETTRTNTVAETIPDYFSKHFNRVLKDPSGEFRSLTDEQSAEDSNNFISFSKQIFHQVTSDIKEPSTFKLISKTEMTKQIPFLQTLLFKRQHEYILPKIVNLPSSVVKSSTLPNNVQNSNNSSTSSIIQPASSLGRKPIVRSKPSDVMVIDDEDEKPKSQFVTAKQFLKKNGKNKDGMSDDDEPTEEIQKKTLSDVKNPTSNYHPVTSLTRNCGENGGGIKRKKFVPPLKDNGNNSNNNNSSSSNSGEKPAKKKKKGGDDEKAPDLSNLFKDGEIPEELSHLDPKLIETISNEILETKVSVTWDDIAGLSYAKKSVQEAVIWPLMRPDLFTGLRRPPKGLLLFGPPGTGKTLIGKAIAHESGSTFFSISASSLTSKWVGEGEKLVRTLFALARYFQPSVVFIDEIDSLLSQRSESDADNGSRRLKTEFLIQLDGASTNDEHDRILIVGATNRPEEIDEAVRRRMGKRLYIPLPSKEGRKEMFLRLLSKNPNTISDEDMEKLVDLTDGYSGSDIKNLCAEASMFAIRDLGSSIRHASADQLRPIEFKDCRSALKSIRPSVAKSDLDRYIEWNKTFGSFDFTENEQEESSAKSD